MMLMMLLLLHLLIHVPDGVFDWLLFFWLIVVDVGIVILVIIFGG
jgi:hypothetical protein